MKHSVPFRGVRKAADLTKPIDKRVYKVKAISSSRPFSPVFWKTLTDHVLCEGDLSNLPWFWPPWLSQDWTGRGWYCPFISWTHFMLKDTHTTVFCQVIPLLVGFSGGQIQLIDPARYVISSFFVIVFSSVQIVFRTHVITGKSLVDCTTRSDWWTKAGCHA